MQRFPLNKVGQKIIVLTQLWHSDNLVVTGHSLNMHASFESQVTDVTIFFWFILIKADKNHSFDATDTFRQLCGRSYDIHTSLESQVADITI